MHHTWQSAMPIALLTILCNEEIIMKLNPNLFEPKIALQFSYDSLILINSFTNNSPHTVYLAPKGSLPVGIIHCQSREELEKQWHPGSGLRKPYTLDEYQKVLPYNTHKEVFELHKEFYFLFGCHDYKLIFYNGYFYPDDKEYHELGTTTLEFSWCNPIEHDIPKIPKMPSIFDE